MKKHLALLLVLSLITVLSSACGKVDDPAQTEKPTTIVTSPTTVPPTAAPDPTEPPKNMGDAGNYILESATLDGIFVDNQETLDLIGFTGFSIRLGEDGVAHINTGESIVGTWEPGVLRYKQSGEDVYNDYSVKDNVLSIDLDGGESGLATLNFRLEGTMPPPTEKPELTAEAAALIGEYICTGWDWDGDFMEPEGEWLRLNDDGSGTYFESIMEEEITWSVEGNILTLVSDYANVYTGTIESDSKIVMDGYSGSTIKYIYEKGSIDDMLAAQAAED